MRGLCVNAVANLWFAGTFASAVCTATILVSPLVASRGAFGFGRALFIRRFLVARTLRRLMSRFTFWLVQPMISPGFALKIHCTICVNGIWVLLGAEKHFS